MSLSPANMRALAGFGQTVRGDNFVVSPTSLDEVRQVLELARATSRKILLRGAGRSYGDANVAHEQIALDLSRMRSIRAWDRTTGLFSADGGVTIEQMWRHVLPDGYWPPVVSGTMFPTLAGALAMNIHGKNNYAVGPLGDHVTELEVLFPNGEQAVLTPEDPRFRAVISSFGMLGIITGVKLRMKRVRSGQLRVLPLSCASWDAQFRAFEELEGTADYMVTWIDAFARGSKAGRGVFHAGWYADSYEPASLDPAGQDLPDSILGLLPKSVVWRFLKPLNNRAGMRFLNWGKHTAARFLGNGKPHAQSLVAFSFLLDYVPNWRKAYEPGGFIQYQSFVPKDQAPRVFARQIELQQTAGLETFLAVMKRHRPDRFLFSHGVDGYSLALDFKVTERNRERLIALCHQMNDLVVAAGGKFYFAKDSTLRPADVRASFGDAALAEFADWRAKLDPEGLLRTALAERLGLV